MKDMATGKSKGYGFVSFFNKWVSVSSLISLLVPSSGCDVRSAFLFLTLFACLGRRERHPADGGPVARRTADKDQLGHEEACS